VTDRKVLFTLYVDIIKFEFPQVIFYVQMANNNPHSNPDLRILALSKGIIALSIMSDDSTVLSAAIITTDATDHNSVCAGASAAICAARFDWKLQVRSRTAEVEALIVFVLMGVVIITDRLAVGIVV
jgi:hypothetical protein